MSNSEIFNFQNTKENQFIIVAQHFEYKSAKKISFILLCVSVVVPIIINVLITLDLDNVMLGVLALISIITLIVGEILKYLIDIKKKNAALLQQYFDLNVFGLNDYEKVDIDKISELLVKYERKDWKRKSNWYLNHNENTKNKSIFRCQQENLNWTKRVANKYITLLIISFSILVSVFLIVSVLNQINISSFLLQILSFLPLGTYVCSGLKKMLSDEKELRDALAFSNQINDKLYKISDSSLEKKIIILQGKIYSIRKQRYLVPDWFEFIYYKRFNKIEERKEKINKAK